MPVTPREFYRNKIQNTNWTTLYTPTPSSTSIYQELHLNSVVSGTVYADTYVSGEGRINIIREGVQLTSGNPVVWQGNLITASGAFVMKTASGVHAILCGLEII